MRRLVTAADLDRLEVIEMNKREAMAARIKAHGLNLLGIFPCATERDPVALCKKLRRLEVEAARGALAYCNGEMETPAWEEFSDKILARVEKILQTRLMLSDVPPVLVNGDPRGYTLKISDEWMARDCAGHRTGKKLHKDWGGYGILAPDLSEGGGA